MTPPFAAVPEVAHHSSWGSLPAKSPDHRLAIRAAEFRPEGDLLAMAGGPKNHDEAASATSSSFCAV